LEGTLKRASNDAELLLELSQDVPVFCTEWGDSYADIEVDGHRETWPLASNEFGNWLIGRFYRSQRCAVGQSAFASALRTLTAKASLETQKRPVFLRIAEFEGKRYLDLCNDKWEAVEVSSTGWNVVAKPPVRFRRLPGMESLPYPKRGGGISALRPFLGNIGDDGFVLVVGYLLVLLNGRGPYPLLVYSGVQGSAKSSATRYTRRVIDPVVDLLGTLPRTQPEESRAVAGNFILAWDNVSQLDGRTSDRLCRLSTGGASPQYRGHLIRPCASNLRPMILNGIVGFVRRPDLADRAMFVPLGTLPDGEKKPEHELANQFVKAWPKILGALLDGVAAGLGNIDGLRPANVGRMADMVQFVAGCEGVLWKEPKFAAAYAASNMRGAEILTVADPVTGAIVAYMDQHGSFMGTATDLLTVLKETAPVHLVGLRLPGGPSPLSEALTRAEPVLERLGIIVVRDRVGSGGSRIIEIKRIERSPPAVKPKSRPGAKVPPALQMSEQLSFALSGSTDDADGN
jgi:hypothetical protein